ncbi:MAG TPA: preprotein translocase subunit SecE [Candidatus Saccharimonadales bacterium]|jgi:preprotein translocase SecE subunit|nr:preprotein translocase subunit SecE [Candidatus Saccharimonadales bacterium]
MLQPTLKVGYFNWEKMVAETSAERPKRRLHKAETVRDKVEKTATASGKPRRVHTTAHKAAAPFRLIGRISRRLGRIKVLHIISLILLPRYFRNSWKELRQVTWPKWRESRQLTAAVIVFAIIFGVLIALADYGLDKLFKQVLVK